MSEITTIDNQTVATQSDAPSAVTGESVVNKNNCINSLKSYSFPSDLYSSGYGGHSIRFTSVKVEGLTIDDAVKAYGNIGAAISNDISGALKSLENRAAQAVGDVVDGIKNTVKETIFDPITNSDIYKGITNFGNKLLGFGSDSSTGAQQTTASGTSTTQQNSGSSSLVSGRNLQIMGAVDLYIPNDITVSTNQLWQSENTGFLGLALKELMNLNNNVSAGVDASAINTVGHAVQYGARKLINGVVNTATSPISDTGNRTGGNLLDQSVQSTTNPHPELFFKGVSLRQFSYSFILYPKNEQESQTIRDIVKFFRKGSSAGYIKQAGTAFLTYPNYWMIQYLIHGADNQFMNKIALCVLNGIDISYSPLGFQAYRDGAPQAIMMQLNFSEAEAITKEMIDQGY